MVYVVAIALQRVFWLFEYPSYNKLVQIAIQWFKISADDASELLKPKAKPLLIYYLVFAVCYY